MSGLLPVVRSDPRELGAKCDSCALGGRREEIGLKLGDWNPVMSELRSTRDFAVGEAPGADEAEAGRPWVGAAGEELMRGLTAVGVPRSALSFGNTICCQPPGNKFDRLIRKIEVRNREIRKRTPPGEIPDLLTSPVENCRPRLIAEALRYQNLILLGGKALRAFAAGSIIERHGGAMRVGLLPDNNTTVELEENEAWPPLKRWWKVMPLLHPSFVMQTKRYREFFKIGLGRSFRFFEDRMAWRRPTVIYDPKRVTPAAIRALHQSKLGSFVVIDVETNYHPAPWSTKENRCRLTGECSRGCVRQTFLEQKIRCVGVGDADHALVIPLLSVDGETKFYAPGEEAAVLAALRDLWVDPRVLKVGHNYNWAEFLSLSRAEYLGYEPMNYRDSMLDAQLADSEMPLNLQMRVLMHEDAPVWKGDIRENPRSDEELFQYNGVDVSANARLAPHQWAQVAARRQEHLVPWAHQKGLLCARMHQLGVGVDQKRRAKWEVTLKNEIEKWVTRARDLCGRPDFNPNSSIQVGKILFEGMGLTPIKTSDKTGEPSADDETLVDIYGKQLAPTDPRREFVRAIRFVRKPVKMFGTYVKSSRPRWMEGGWAWDDGLHTEWKSWGAKSGRLAGGDPYSLQTIPGKPPYNLRSMIVPRPGHVWVSGDLDQVELKIYVALSGSKRYIEMLALGHDPHGVVAEMAFKERYTKAPGYVDPRTGKKPKKGTVADRLRDLVKRVVYGLAYGAFVPTLHAQIVSAEDDRGELIYADADIAETELVYNAIHAFAPEFKKWGDATIRSWQRDGFVFEPVLGRRRDCLDSTGWHDTGDEREMEVNEMMNHPIQCVPGFTRVLTREGYLPIVELVGKRFDAWTGKKWAAATAIEKGEAELWRVKTDRGIDFVCDASHKLRVAKHDGYEWREVRELGANRRVALDLAQPLEFGARVDGDDAYMIGLWLSDGFCSRLGRDVGFVVSYDEAAGRGGQAQLDRVVAWCARRGMRPTVEAARGCWRVTTFVGGDYWVWSWGADVAWKAMTKRVPERVWRVSLEARQAFLRGFLDGDGHSTADGGVNVNLCQRRLCEELWLLARTCGIDGGLTGPYKADRKGHLAWRLRLNGAQTFDALGWGRACRLRTRAAAPYWAARRAWKAGELRAKAQADSVIISRIKRGVRGRGRGSMPKVSPYVLARMGAEGLHDHAVVTSAAPRRVRVPVYTLSVDDAEHAYVAEGFISKNSSAAALMDIILSRILTKYSWGFGGPYTGIVLQAHDSYSIETPIEMAQEVCNDLSQMMTLGEVDALPGIRITAEANVEARYGMENCQYCGKYMDWIMERFVDSKGKPYEVCRCGNAQEWVDQGWMTQIQ